MERADGDELTPREAESSPRKCSHYNHPEERGTYFQRVLKTNTVFRFPRTEVWGQARSAKLCDLGPVYSAPRRLSHQLHVTTWPTDSDGVFWEGFPSQEQRPTASGLDQEGSMQVM